MPALIAAAASVVVGTTSNLMQNKMFKAQAEKTQLEARLAGLDSTQQYILAQQLQQAKSDNEKFAILQEAASKIDVADTASTAAIFQEALKQRAKETQTTAIIIGSAVVLLIGSYFVIYKQK